MRGTLKKLWNYRLPYRNRFTFTLGIVFLILAIILIIRYYFGAPA